MGLLRFLLHRGVDFVLPGVGMVMDLMDAVDIIQTALEAGELTDDQVGALEVLKFLVIRTRCRAQVAAFLT